MGPFGLGAGGEARDFLKGILRESQKVHIPLNGDQGLIALGDSVPGTKAFEQSQKMKNHAQ